MKHKNAPVETATTGTENFTQKKKNLSSFQKKSKNLIIALAGNPNAGKTTLFNSLTGLRQKVANYPGVTVERKEGWWMLGDDQQAKLIDLPGLYSLDATSLDEQIARDVLTGEVAGLSVPDAIIAVVDATNLERNLYLVTQLMEYDIPIVVALTMTDEAEKRKIQIDCAKLSDRLGVSVVPIIAAQKIGIRELNEKVSDAITRPAARRPEFFLESEESPNAKIFARYNFISDVFQNAVREGETSDRVLSDWLDRILTHRVFGFLFLIGILLIVFQAIFSWATLPMDLLEQGFGWLGDVARNALPAGMLTDLLVDGVIAGVGGVLVFLPQILLLFLFLSLLEDTGYMARAAFLLDRLMRGVGLHGKAFVPLLSSFACAIPGIMATRTIENRRDRLATILVAPFMSCSARLPVYAVMIAAFFAGQTVLGFISVGALLMLAMYALGIITAIIAAFILKRTLLKAPPPPFVMELPPYRMPNLRTVLQNMFQRAGLFLKRAGTVILAISIVLWALTAFPRVDEQSVEPRAQTEITQETCNCSAEELQKLIEDQKQSYALQQSYAGRLGRFLEPAIEPLGFDWKIGVALVASFAAREVLVSTLSIIYNVGKDENENSETLIGAIRDARRDDGSKTWTPLTGLTLMVFFVLAIQCMSTVAVVRRETNSWAWTAFMIAYMTVLAYAAAFVTYQGGKLLGY